MNQAAITGCPTINGQAYAIETDAFGSNMKTYAMPANKEIAITIDSTDFTEQRDGDGAREPSLILS